MAGVLGSIITRGQIYFLLSQYVSLYYQYCHSCAFRKKTVISSQHASMYRWQIAIVVNAAGRQCTLQFATDLSCFVQHSPEEQFMKRSTAQGDDKKQRIQSPCDVYILKKTSGTLTLYLKTSLCLYCQQGPVPCKHSQQTRLR